ncbi:alpha/beta-hydrolase [Hypomontagnella submonticulosa]|nr:alpha/beta-hydrolase [Hypomontagnella submonticulosa]
MKLFKSLILSLSLATATAAVLPELSAPAPFNSSHSEVIGSITWHYLRALPSGKYKGTVLLLHGFPDLPTGWKNQVPLFTSLGYQVIAPEMLGYGQTSSPCELSKFAFKAQSDSLAALMDKIVPGEKVILGGHDWGAGLLWRFLLWHPDLFKAIFSIGFFFNPPVTEYVDLAVQIAAGNSSTFKYQLEFRDVSFDRNFEDETRLRQFLTAAYDGTTANGTRVFTPDGVNLDLLPLLEPSPLLNGTELEQHLAELRRHSFRGPLNWYRLEKLNFEDELPIARAGGIKFTQPILFIQPLRDPVLTPELSKGGDQFFDKLTRAEVDSRHWALIEKPTEVNKEINSWLATLK